MSVEAVPLICMCLVFRHRSLYTWRCQNKSYLLRTPSLNRVILCDIRQADRESRPILYNGMKCTLLLSSFLFRELSPLRSRGLELSATLSHRCRVSLYDFIINGCQCVAQERRAGRSVGASCAVLAQPQSQSKCKWLQVMRKDSGCPFSIDTLRLCCSIPPISASSLPSLVSLWQPLGILGNRLVYSTFHHIGCWIIHLTISRGQKEGEEELESGWKIGERERQRENEWMDRIYTSCSGKLIIEIWSASHILWLLKERAQCACLAEISGPPVDNYASAGRCYSEQSAHQCSQDPGINLGPYILCPFQLKLIAVESQLQSEIMYIYGMNE